MDAIAVARRILAELSGRDEEKIEREMDLVADLGIDSPKALQLLVKLEDDLGIEISDEDAAAMDTVGDIYRYLDGALPART